MCFIRPAEARKYFSDQSYETELRLYFRPQRQPRRDRTKMSIQQLITPEKHNLGGFSVQRILPSETLKMVGPYILNDH